MPEPPMDEKGKRNRPRSLVRPGRSPDLRHEPCAGGQHSGLTGIESRVGIVVGDGVYAVGIVTNLYEVPKEEVDGLHDLGHVPPAVSGEDVGQTFSTQQIADPDAEQVAGGLSLLVAECQRDDSSPLELVGDVSEGVHALRFSGHKILVAIDDYLLEQIGNPVDGAVVGGALLGPVVDVPAILFVGLLQGIEEPSVGQHATEAGAGIVGEYVGRIVGSQPVLYDRTLILRRHRLALHVYIRVLLLEPCDDLLRRPLKSGRLPGCLEKPDGLTPTPSATGGAQEHRAGEPHTDEPEEIFAVYRPRHLLLTCSPSLPTAQCFNACYVASQLS